MFTFRGCLKYQTALIPDVSLQSGSNKVEKCSAAISSAHNLSLIPEWMLLRLKVWPASVKVAGRFVQRIDLEASFRLQVLILGKSYWIDVQPKIGSSDQDDVVFLGTEFWKERVFLMDIPHLRWGLSAPAWWRFAVLRALRFF